MTSDALYPTLALLSWHYPHLGADTSTLTHQCARFMRKAW
jgi:hypothetical protein